MREKEKKQSVLVWGVAKITSNSNFYSYELKKNTAFRTLKSTSIEKQTSGNLHTCSVTWYPTQVFWFIVLEGYTLLSSAAHQKTGHVAGCIIFSPWILKCHIHGQFHDYCWLPQLWQQFSTWSWGHISDGECLAYLQSNKKSKLNSDCLGWERFS